jgi:ATP-binding cassette subfamily B protein
VFAVRANIGVIFQDFVRYHFSAADNIASVASRSATIAHASSPAAERSLATR